jgi:hypothetical protein
MAEAETKPPKVPPSLLVCVEKLMVNLTQDLDPYVALRIINETKRVAGEIYLIGYDVRRNKCENCPNNK